MRTIIKKLLKESTEKKQLFVMLKQIDKFLVKKDWKKDFFGDQGSTEMVITFEHLINDFMNKFGYSAEESRFIIGAYYETYGINDEITDPEQVIIPKQSKYKTNYEVYVRGRMYGKMTTSDRVYSPIEAAWIIHNYNWKEKTIDSDETEWEDFEIEIPYKTK